MPTGGDAAQETRPHAQTEIQVAWHPRSGLSTILSGATRNRLAPLCKSTPPFVKKSARAAVCCQK
eukprot:15475023-Alexandrium_andersonii.AAC.1